MATASIPPAARTDAELRRRRLVGHRIRQARHRLVVSQEWLARADRHRPPGRVGLGARALDPERASPRAAC